MSIHTFPSYITREDGEAQEVTVSVTTYHPGTPDTIRGPGNDPEIDWELVDEQGKRHPLNWMVCREDADRIESEIHREMQHMARESRAEARFDRWLDTI